MKPVLPPTPVNGSRTSQSCGLLRRLAIILYDSVVVIALLMLATLVALLAGFQGGKALTDPFFTLYLFIVWFVYLAWCWRKGGMTLGMRAWRVRIEDENGDCPGWKHCSIRFAVSLLSAALAGAGFFWSLVDAEKRCWHDIASATRLVRL